MTEIPQGLERFIARQSRKRHLAAVWARLAGLEPGMVVADIGCGTGILTQEYARIVGPTGIVYGVEQRVALADHLTGAGNVRFLFHDYDFELKLERRPDRIFLTDTLHHQADPLAVLRCIRTAGLPDSRVLIAEYDPDGPGLVGAKRHRRIPKTQLLSLIEAAGFAHNGAIDTEDEHYAVIAGC
jgi:SAM-dependent methyltransferase